LFVTELNKGCVDKNKKNRGLQIKKMWYNYNHIEI
jgi:hypothetical protein